MKVEQQNTKELSEQALKKLVEELLNYEEIKLIDIPCVDLYMDQVTTFFEDKLKGLKRNEEKILTKTMINNYVKGKLLTPVKSKKYNKEQILLLILIYHLKQNLSISDIGILLSPLLKDAVQEQNKRNLIEKVYTGFLKINEIEKEEFNKEFEEKIASIKEKIENCNEDEKNIELILSVLMLINSANMQKRMAEKIIDNFFSK